MNLLRGRNDLMLSSNRQLVTSSLSEHVEDNAYMLRPKVDLYIARQQTI